jgi:PsbP
MKKINTVLLCMFSAALLHAQADNNSKPKWIKQQDSVYNFSFEYPENWQLKLPGTNTRFFVTSQPESDNDHFRENINCIVRIMNDSSFKIMNAETAIVESLQKGLTAFKLLKKAPVKWNGTDALTIEYTCTQKSEEKEFNIHMYQQMALVNNRLFTLSFTAKDAHYSKYIAVIKKIIGSVRTNP